LFSACSGGIRWPECSTWVQLFHVCRSRSWHNRSRLLQISSSKIFPLSFRKIFDYWEGVSPSPRPPPARDTPGADIIKYSVFVDKYKYKYFRPTSGSTTLILNLLNF
jgi:hypothetical protein